MFDRKDRVIWVHGDQLEHHGHCLISNGMTRAQVLEKLGQPINPLKRVEACSTEVNYFHGGASVALVNQHVVFSTVTAHIDRDKAQREPVSAHLK